MLYEHFDYRDSFFSRKKITRKEKLYKLFFPKAYKIRELEKNIVELKDSLGDTSHIQNGMYDRLFSEAGGSYQTVCMQIAKIKDKLNSIKKNQDDFNKLLLDHFGLESKLINTTPKIVIRKKSKTNLKK